MPKWSAAVQNAPEPKYERGYGWMYSQHISQTDQGCDFNYLTREFGRPVDEPDIY